MKKNKNVRIVFIALFSVILSSCASMGTSIKLDEDSIPYLFDDVLSAEITGVRHGLSSIRSKGKTFSLLNAADEAMEVKISVINYGSQSENYRTPDSFELLVLNENGVYEFIKYSNPNEFVGFGMNILDEEEIKPGKTFKDKVFFVYPSSSKPIAILLNRADPTYLIPVEDESYFPAQEFIAKSSKIEELFAIALSVDFTVVKNFMDLNEIDVNQKNTNGLTLLTLGILGGKTDLLRGLLENGAVINDPLYFKGNMIMPIHLAVFTHNSQVVDVLIENGADLRYKDNEIEEVAAIAIRSNDIETVKFLIAMNVNLWDVKLRMAMSPSLSAYDYVTQKGRPEILQLMQQQNPN